MHASSFASLLQPMDMLVGCISLFKLNFNTFLQSLFVCAGTFVFFLHTLHLPYCKFDVLLPMYKFDEHEVKKHN